MIIEFNDQKFLKHTWIREVFSSNSEMFTAVRRAATEYVSDISENEKINPAAKYLDETYFVSLWMLKAIDELALTSRFVNLFRDLTELNVLKEDSDSVERYANSLGIESSISGNEFTVNLIDFIRCSKRLTGNQYRLVFQNPRNGYVKIKTDTIAKIIREQFVLRSFDFYSKIDRSEALKELSNIEEFLYSIKQQFIESRKKDRIELGSIDSSKFPPCITRYLSDMKDGVNLPHMARFTLVSFLSKIGMTAPEIIELFRSAPDFSEKFTTYQVNHITGGISGTVYSPPKCSVLLSNHLCYKGEDTLCNQEWLKHPLRYYQIKKMRDQKAVVEKR